MSRLSGVDGVRRLVRVATALLIPGVGLLEAGALAAAAATVQPCATHLSSSLKGQLQRVIDADIGPKGWPRGTVVFMPSVTYAQIGNKEYVSAGCVVPVTGATDCRMAFERSLPGAWHFANPTDFPSAVATRWAICAKASTPAAGHPAAASVEPSHSTALEYASRTYIIVRQGGKQRFQLIDQRQTVKAADGSTITAFPIENDFGGMADSVSWTVMFFRNGKFLGWSGSRAAGSGTVLDRLFGDAIRVAYPKPNQPTCCQSAEVWVSYTWNGARIVASAQQPSSSYVLHLAPG